MDTRTPVTETMVFFHIEVHNVILFYEGLQLVPSIYSASRAQKDTWLRFKSGKRHRVKRGWGWGTVILRVCRVWPYSQSNREDTFRWLGGTHQGLQVLFLGATDTGEDVLVLTLRYSLCPSGSLALGRMLAIHFKFIHMLGGSATAGATLGRQNTREEQSSREGRK